MLMRGAVGQGGEHVGDAAGDGVAQPAHGGVVAVGPFVEHGVSAEVLGFELCVRGVGLGGAQAGVEPEHLEIGECGGALIVGDGAGTLELAQHGNDLGDQPALLAVGAQQQTYV